LKVEKEENVILVFGDEKELSDQILKSARYNVSFKPQNNENLINKFPFTVVDSINNSVACSLLLNRIKH
jgi:tRNA G18 (ribose-2'-O)-methylase SpoU